MEIKSRKDQRLEEYNYSKNGYYFVTLCTENRQCILSEIVGGGVLDTPLVTNLRYGEIVAEQIETTNKIYEHLQIDKYVIMPNHVHMVVIIRNGASRTPPPTGANAVLPAFVSTFKRFTNKNAGVKLWQRDYYEHVIRSEQEYIGIWQYIDDNPKKWVEDEYYNDGR